MASFDAKFGNLAQTILQKKYLGERTWKKCVEDIINSVVNFNSTTRNLWTESEIQLLRDALYYRWFLPAGRYIYYSDKAKRFYNNCLLLKTQGDSREGWAKTVHDAIMGLMSGAGIGIEYSEIRGKGEKLKGTGGEASGPLSLMEMINEIGKRVQQGGTRRSAIYSSLHWKHSDIFTFIDFKNWSELLKQRKNSDVFEHAPLDITNISVRLDRDFWRKYHENDYHAQVVFNKTIKNMLLTSEPGFQNDWDNQILRNACTEVISADPYDICNLGSVNLSRIDNKKEFENIVIIATKFLYCGSIASEVPIDDVEKVKEKNRRIGVGLMGFHEWLLKRNFRYEMNDELKKWLEIYRDTTEAVGREISQKSGESLPKAFRSIAPNGTIGMIAETTTGIEPIYATAYKRKYIMGENDRRYQFVIDSTAKRLIDEGYVKNPEDIEDSLILSDDPERRIRFQWEVQKYVDQAISSTINIPNVKILNGGFENYFENFKKILIRYLPELRGLTVYSDGSRGGQPLEKVDFKIAKNYEGIEYSETSTLSCGSGLCGS